MTTTITHEAQIAEARKLYAAYQQAIEAQRIQREADFETLCTASARGINEASKRVVMDETDAALAPFDVAITDARWALRTFFRTQRLLWYRGNEDTFVADGPDA